MSAIDFSDAFLQVELDEEAQLKTAFSISGKGYFSFSRMPFGLCNSGATLCRLEVRVIGCDMEPYVFVYLDDIIIATETYEHHFQLLSKISERLSKANLTISVEKSRFCMKELKYLGYIIGRGSIRPNPEKTSSIHNYPQPKNVKDVRRLLGMAGWYRRFIQDFSAITAPLTELTKKGRTFKWTEEADKALSEIKNALVSEPVLTNPNYNEPFTIQTDASDLGMGGVLVQGEGKGKERVIAYMSAKFSPSQRKYSTTERECLAVITAIEKFRHYIEGSKFKVITDHASLLWLKNLKDPTGRLCRWALRLQPYDFELVHRKGTQMVVADALSRAIETIDISSFSKSSDNWYNLLRKKIIENSQKYPQYRVEQDRLYKICTNNKTRYGYISKWKVVVPESERRHVIDECHSNPLSAHGGYHKTVDRVKRDYYWPQLDKQVRDFVRQCEVYNSIKPSNHINKAPMGNFRDPARPWHMLYLDFIGPLPRSKNGHSHILTVVDSFSKFVHAHPLNNATSKHLLNFCVTVYFTHLVYLKSS